MKKVQDSSFSIELTMSFLFVSANAGYFVIVAVGATVECIGFCDKNHSYAM